MNTYIVTYDLVEPDRNYNELYRRIRTYKYRAPITESVGNQQNWDTLRPERSGVGLRSSQLPECPVVLSSPLDCLGLHFLPAS